MRRLTFTILLSLAGLLSLTIPARTQLVTFTVVPLPTPTLPILLTPTIITGNAIPTPTPVDFAAPLVLDANFFNPQTGELGIHFKMDSGGQAKVSIYNMAGELVRNLLNEYRNRGSHTIYWEGHNANGALVGNAIYYIVFHFPGGQTTQKVILLK